MASVGLGFKASKLGFGEPVVDLKKCGNRQEEGPGGKGEAEDADRGRLLRSCVSGSDQVTQGPSTLNSSAFCPNMLCDHKAVPAPF